MSTIKPFSIISFILFTFFSFASCSKLPQAEIDAAQAAIDSARMEGLSPGSSLKFALLEDSILQIFETMELHKSIISFKNLDESRHQLIILTREINLLREENNSEKVSKTLKEKSIASTADTEGVDSR